MAICKNPQSRDEALNAMHRTISKMAHKFARNHKSRDYDDLYQNGVEGMLIAYDRFDPSRGVSFSTYAYHHIWAEIITSSKKNYNNYNNTSAKSVDDVQKNNSYSMPLDEMVDYKKRMEKLDKMSQLIVKYRAEGYTFDALANALTSIGYPITLHQCRNKYLAAIDGLEMHNT